MEQRNYDNSGSLFVNDRKTTDKHPDYKGSIIINGQKYWLSGWLRSRDKKDGSGKVEFISLSAEAQESETRSDAKPVSGFPSVGGMLAAAATIKSDQARGGRSQASAPKPAPAFEPIQEEVKDDLPF